MVHKGSNQPEYSTDSNPWWGNLFWSLNFGFCSWLMIGPTFMFAFFGWPNLLNETMWKLNWLPAEVRAW